MVCSSISQSSLLGFWGLHSFLLASILAFADHIDFFRRCFQMMPSLGKIVQRATCRRDFFRPFQNTQAKRACSTREDYSPAFYSNAGVAPAPRRDTIGLGRFKVDVEQILPIERADLEWTHLAYEVFRLLNEGNLEGAHDVYRRTSTVRTLLSQKNRNGPS
jgi:hypothetical protein